MLIAIEGCAHGELDNIYSTVSAIEEERNVKVDLLICCGDFQAVRNIDDLTCMAIPQKYYNMRSFYKYYNGEKKAPTLTLVIGGNHEASNYLQELPFGGWLAPNIYYLGYAGVVNFGGLRIGGISGIYKAPDFMRGHYETLPYDENTKRSVYHTRNIEIFRLNQLSNRIDVFVSHDWPANITKFGNKKLLLKKKPFFRDDIESGKLGSPPCKEVLDKLKPNYWFAAHLHCKFPALVKHSNDKVTKFLALDKCLPHKHFLQILEMQQVDDAPLELQYDLEWLTILHLTDHLFSTKKTLQYMPSKLSNERWDFTPTDEEKEEILMKFDHNLKVPDNFCQTAKGYDPNSDKKGLYNDPVLYKNEQTTHFCETLQIHNPCHLIESNQSIAALNDSRNDSIQSVENSSADSTETLKRKSMSLPEPVNNQYENIQEEFDVTDEAGNEIKEEEEVALDLVVEKVEGVKKFKRRNASIYMNDNDDVS